MKQPLGLCCAGLLWGLILLISFGTGDSSKERTLDVEAWVVANLGKITAVAVEDMPEQKESPTGFFFFEDITKMSVDTRSEFFLGTKRGLTNPQRLLELTQVGDDRLSFYWQQHIVATRIVPAFPESDVVNVELQLEKKDVFRGRILVAVSTREDLPVLQELRLPVRRVKFEMQDGKWKMAKY